MRILSVIESLEPDGAETVLVELALGLREHDHRVAHFSAANGCSPHLPFLRSLERAGVPAVDVHWGELNDGSERSTMLAGFTPDVVLFHWWGKDPWAPWIQSLAELPPGRRPVFVCILHRAAVPAPAGYDRYVLVTRAQQGQVAHLAAERVHVIRNGVDLARFRAAAPARRSRSEIVIGRLSSLRSGKIPADWIHTAAGYGIPGAEWVIAGGGSLASHLERDVGDLGLEERFSLPGYVPPSHVPSLLAGFDVFGYATGAAVECHPLALLESLAAGVPIVAECRGGIPEIVTHGVNGLLAGSVDELGEHLGRLARDAGLRKRLARGARESAKLFSRDRQLRGYRDLLAAVERERASSGRPVFGSSQ